jgi:DNA processing protein
MSAVLPASTVPTSAAIPRASRSTSALSRGTNDLLRQGAAPLLSCEDVLTAIGIDGVPSPERPVSPTAGALLVALDEGARGADELVWSSGCTSAEIAPALVELELAGLVSQGDGVYRLTAG